jgi:bifunctional ADP-heptose synthase (sugar kinase/adenylyltransferase)
MELLLQRLQCQALVVTRGARGLNVLEANGRFAHIPAVPREVYDATGAGDTFIATMALALGAGTSYLEAAALGNYAASVAVGKLGTATVAAEELVHALALQLRATRIVGAPHDAEQQALEDPLHLFGDGRSDGLAIAHNNSL